MRKLLLAMTMVASAVFADPGHGMDGNEKLCPNYGTNRIGSMYTDGYGPFVSGEFLYWTSQMDGLDLAYTQQVVQGSVTHAKQKVIAPSFDWDPAFRVGLGYYCDCMDWSLFLEWTRLRSDVKTSHERETNYELVSLWSRPSVSNTLTLNQITSHWNFAYDTLDLSLCPGYFRYKYFAIKPEFGLRGAWIDWRYDVNSDYTEAGVPLTFRIANKNDFHGIGFVAKVNLKWFIGYGFQLYANALSSVLYGQFNVSQPTHIVTTGSDRSLSFSEKYWRVKSNVHLALGLAWERFFMDNGIRLNVHAGYESLNWFNQNQLRKLRVIPFGQNPTLLDIVSINDRDDLGLSGFTIGAGLEF